MKQFNIIIFSLILCTTCLADHHKQTPGKMDVNSLTGIAIVTAINPETRIVTLRGRKGEVFEYYCDDSVRNFDQIEVGDVVKTTITSSVLMSVDKKPQELKHEVDETSQNAKLGDKPAGIFEQTVTITGVVQKIDYKKEAVVLKYKDGTTNTFELKGKAPRLKEIKKGDTVTTVMKEVVSIVVSK